MGTVSAETIGPRSGRRPFRLAGYLRCQPVFLDASGERWVRLPHGSTTPPDAIYRQSDTGIPDTRLRRIAR